MSNCTDNLSQCGCEVPSPLTTAPAQVPVPRLPTYGGRAPLPVPLSHVDKKALLVKGGVDVTWYCRVRKSMLWKFEAVTVMDGTCSHSVSRQSGTG